MTSSELKERTQLFALRIMRLAEELPKGVSGRAIANQIVRSGTSVGANYRSACRARSRAEFAAKLGVAVEEADKTAYWLELILKAGLIPETRLSGLMQEAGELAAILTAAHKTTTGRRTVKPNPPSTIRPPQ